MPFVNVDARIRLLGTAHVSQHSVEEVIQQIEEFEPDIVAVELCQSRHDALIEERRFDKEGLLKVLKEGKAPLVLLQSMLSAEQRKLGIDEELQPGAELLTAVKEARARGIEVELVDRDIQVTLRRAWKEMRFREKFKLMYSFLLDEDDDEDIEIDELLENTDLLSSLMEDLKEFSPGAGTVLIDERDDYLSGKIMSLPKDKKILAVVGAGHLEGVSSRMKGAPIEQSKIEEISRLPKRSLFSSFLPWFIPAALIGFVGWLMWSQQDVNWVELFTIWTLSNAVFASLACILARGHPLAVLTAGLASPITSLNPALAAGWFAGYVQLKVREPTTQDLQDFLKLDEFSQFWKNPAGKVLLVTALTNLGSMVGAWVATAGYLGGWTL